METEAYLTTLQDNWSVPISVVLGFQGMVMPYGEPETWEEGLLATLAVLSEAMAGQADVVATLIAKKVKEMAAGRGKGTGNGEGTGNK